MQLTLPLTHVIPATSKREREVVKAAIAIAREMPQTPFVTEHVIHGGMYTRSVIIPADQWVGGVLIKVPTTLVIVGDVEVYQEKKNIVLRGYNTLRGSAGRKISFRTFTVVGMSMMFATQAKTVAEAEAELTDEVDLLPPLSQVDAHRFVITGE